MILDREEGGTAASLCSRVRELLLTAFFCLSVFQIDGAYQGNPKLGNKLGLVEVGEQTAPNGPRSGGDPTAIDETRKQLVSKPRALDRLADSGLYCSQILQLCPAPSDRRSCEGSNSRARKKKKKRNGLRTTRSPKTLPGSSD